MKWTTDELVALMDKAESGDCDKNCETCPIFLPTRNECWTIADKKWQEWAKKKSQEFQKFMKEYNG